MIDSKWLIIFLNFDVDILFKVIVNLLKKIRDRLLLIIFSNSFYFFFILEFFVFLNGFI